MIYFAYGSNLDRRQMAARCPGSRPVGVARLVNHRLCFPRRSPVRNCAVAGLAPEEGAVVWGALYAMTADDIVRLDRREGYAPGGAACHNRYVRAGVDVTDEAGEAVRAITYFATRSPSPGLPSPEYMAQIIGGAEEWGFPPDYVATLRSLPTAPAGAGAAA